MRGIGFEKNIAVFRILLAALLIAGIYPVWIESLLLMSSILLIKRFHGPYNGGSDTMSILLLLCLWGSHIAPSRLWQEVALGYGALQLTLSYFQAGWVKLINAEWRSGKALAEVFLFSAYPVSESLRALPKRNQLLFVASWCVIIGEFYSPWHY